MIGYTYNKGNGNLDLTRFSYSFISNFILFYSLYILNFDIIQRKLQRTAKFWIACIGSIILSIIIDLCFNRLLVLIHLDFHIANKILLAANLMKDLVIVSIVLLTTYLLHSIFNHQQTLLENQRLISENMRIRYEVLKNQVDPHFLFNSLNTLDGLISIDTDRAHDYVQNLSSVFRYAIGNKEIMHLDEELNFTESYANLMRIRYGDNLQVIYNIDDKYKSFHIMPISLQLLVENAIKHNVISNKQPLTIHIESTDNESIKVWNMIQKKNQKEEGEGIGLANLTERYNLLFQREISINSTDIFSVEIPLIKDLDKEKQELEKIHVPKRCI